jgi:hypothetical protein
MAIFSRLSFPCLFTRQRKRPELPETKYGPIIWPNWHVWRLDGKNRSDAHFAGIVRAHRRIPEHTATMKGVWPPVALPGRADQLEKKSVDWGEAEAPSARRHRALLTPTEARRFGIRGTADECVRDSASIPPQSAIS